MKKLISISVFLLCFCLSEAQPEYERELLYLHVNSTLFFPGEYLYYKAYCINDSKDKLSRLSSFATVELIDEDLNIVSSQKIELQDGTGFGDIFIPNQIGSGNYKLIAYTRWMQNFGIETFFQTDISIINPYLSNQEGILINDDKVDGALKDLDTVNPKNVFHMLEIDLNKTVFGSRDEVQLQIKNNSNEMGYGSYSVSVKKVDDFRSHNRTSSVDYFKLNKAERVNNLAAIRLQPERKGLVLTGKVLHKHTEQPMANTEVALSVPGDGFHFDVKTTDGNGAFMFSVEDHWQEGNSAILQILGEDREVSRIENSSAPTINYSALQFTPFTISSRDRSKIVERSVFNQIENAYYTKKPDTITEVPSLFSFVHFEKGITYNLDDYSEFSNMDEVFKEIIRFVWIRKNDKGQREIKVFPLNSSVPTNFQPLLFIDGVFVEDQNAVLQFDVGQIRSIKVIRRQYVFGKNIYQGVISIATKSSGYQIDDSYVNVLMIDMNVPKPQKKYFRQSYSSSNSHKERRIPDYRLQLLWDPRVVISSKLTKLSFFTSDVEGLFEIAIEGFAANGNPISLKKYFEVQN
jgi:hypothetical protein